MMLDRARLVRRVGAQSSATDDVPFILSTFEAIGIEAEYDSARGRYMLGEAARTISDVRAQVAEIGAQVAGVAGAALAARRDHGDRVTKAHGSNGQWHLASVPRDT